jgi:hypothetical protein
MELARATNRAIRERVWRGEAGRDEPRGPEEGQGSLYASPACPSRSRRRHQCHSHFTGCGSAWLRFALPRGRRRCLQLTRFHLPVLLWSDWASGSDRSHRSDRTDWPSGPDRTHRSDRPHRTNRCQRNWPDRPSGPDRTHRSDRCDRPHRCQRNWSDGSHRADRTDWPDRSERCLRSKRRNRTYRPNRSDRPHRPHRPHRRHWCHRCQRNWPDRSRWSDRPSGSDRAHRTDRCLRSQRRNWSDGSRRTDWPNWPNWSERHRWWYRCHGTDWTNRGAGSDRSHRANRTRGCHANVHHCEGNARDDQRVRPARPGDHRASVLHGRRRNRWRCDGDRGEPHRCRVDPVLSELQHDLDRGGSGDHPHPGDRAGVRHLQRRTDLAASPFGSVSRLWRSWAGAELAERKSGG